MNGGPYYSIDTSALVDWWVRYYPPSVFAGLVPKMEGLIATGRLRASREVIEEIQYENDGLRDWVRSQAGLGIDSDSDIQNAVRTIMSAYFNAQKPDKGISGADPFVIGLAATRQPEPWIVVSGEKPGSKENPKIPWVCRSYQPKPLQHLSFLEMIRAEGWQI